MLVTQAKLDSINDTISKAIQDENDITSHEEFSKILQETDKYRKLKNDIRTEHAKQKSQAITEKQREAILVEGRKQGKEAFLKQIENTSVTLTAPVT